MMNDVRSPSVKFDPFAKEHDSLSHLLVDVRRTLAERAARRDVVVEVLTDLARNIQSHFVHEEQDDGFFQVVVDQAPRLKRRADALAQEHGQLAKALDQLQSHASRGDTSQRWWAELNDHFESFWTVFSRHEREENTLVQEAFNDDIGAED